MKRRINAFEAALELTEKQYDPLLGDMIDGFIQHAQQEGNKEDVLALLRIIRTRHEHDGIKYGHIWWIRNTLESGKLPADVQNVPSFKKPEG